MPLYIKIDCPNAKLKPLLQNYQDIPFADMAVKSSPNIHYLAFYHTYAVTTARAYAQKKGLQFAEISEDDLRSIYKSQQDFIVKGEVSLSPFLA